MRILPNLFQLLAECGFFPENAESNASPVVVNPQRLVLAQPSFVCRTELTGKPPGGFYRPFGRWAPDPGASGEHGAEMTYRVDAVVPILF
ncbi:hypothetical protein [Arthrobacter sp. NPDC057259]|uniref:hypothetical protein n=1 Tax=Arthrobacter sp. NPDC057259 TaxID=3346073 RepID=UPI003637B1DD